MLPVQIESVHPNADFYQQISTPATSYNDSMIFIEQFLSDFPKELELVEEIQLTTHSLNSSKILQKSKKIKKVSGKSLKKKKKGKREISRFHNLQKHLNVALRNIIKESSFEHSSLIDQKIASLIWKSYKDSGDQSKTILHHFFNEEQAKLLNQQTLEEFGMLEIYKCSGKEGFFKGIQEIRHWICDQMTDAVIQNYINQRRVKNKGVFREYLINFRREVEAGAMRKRFNLSLD